jgi:hypothetical protein
MPTLIEFQSFWKFLAYKEKPKLQWETSYFCLTEMRSFKELGIWDAQENKPGADSPKSVPRPWSWRALDEWFNLSEI